jgi:EAL domain-containing protein (putative c-di-GMP-specific phosphodiesterase class I)
VVSLRTGAVIATEALVRWQHPERGLLGPAAFLDVAAESGLIVAISHWVLATACAQAAVWQERLARPVRVNINMPPQILDDPRLSTQVDEQLKLAGISASALGIELVESSLVEGRASVINFALQGYYFSRPVTADECTRYCNTKRATVAAPALDTEPAVRVAK